MALATNVQIQHFADERIRPHAEMLRDLTHAYDNDISLIDDVYNTLAGPSGTWVDNRQDGPPHLLVASDILAINTFMHDIRDAIKNHGQYGSGLKACVRS